ncbi:MAG: hypothetical protein Q4G51_05685 [Dermatophilus congolensis]|nr:hypothetical protein [Dermatophilus congolensis]
MNWRPIAVGLVGSLALLSACAGEMKTGHAQAPATQTQAAPRVHVGAGVSMGSVAATRVPTDDVAIERCELNATGATAVGGTITNTGSSPASYVATVEVRQDGRRVDGVGLIATRLDAGESTEAVETGVRTGLRGEVTCVVVDVSAVRG